MFDFPKKCIAVLLAIWLPLFSGNALAASIAMQSMGGDCHVAQSDISKLDTPHSHHASTVPQHVQHAAHLAQQNQQHDHQNDQQNSSHKNCGVCQVACCGFMATVAINVTEAQPSAQSFALSSTQFQSVTSAPLDPPPLALA